MGAGLQPQLDEAQRGRDQAERERDQANEALRARAAQDAEARQQANQLQDKCKRLQDLVDIHVEMTEVCM
jgi:hypothetical protein